MIGFSPESIVRSGGILLIGGIVFAESAFLLGILLPGGDTLLFFSGFFASQGLIPIEWLIVSIIVGAIVGDNVGYTIGRRAGPKIFKKHDGIFFRHDHIMKAEKFYESHGGKTITLARFIPVIRTFAPLIAGVAKMDRKRFMLYNVLGAVVWGTSLPLLGYYFGSRIPNIENYLLPVAVFALLVTVLPPLLPFIRNRESRNKLTAAIKARTKKSLGYLSLNKKIDLD